MLIQELVLWTIQLALGAAPPPPQQPAWTPPVTGQSIPPALPGPSPTDLKEGALLAGTLGTIGQQYSPMGINGHPSPSQLAAFNTVAVSNTTTATTTCNDKIRRQMEALTLEHESLT